MLFVFKKNTTTPLMFKTKYFYIFLLLLIFSNNLFAQKNNDFESWSSLVLQYKFNKKWQIGLENQLRLKENSTEIDIYFTEFTINRNLNKHFNTSFGYRFIRENDNVGKKQGYKNFSRLDMNLGYKHKLKRFKLKYRLRYQTKNQNGISKKEGDNPKKQLRLKTAITYNVKNWKLDPFFSTEIFRLYEVNKDSKYNKARFTLGSKYKIKKSGTISFFYRIEKELNKKHPNTTRILGVRYSYIFK